MHAIACPFTRIVPTIVWRALSKEDPQTQTKVDAEYFCASFYDNVGLIFKGSNGLSRVHDCD